MLNPHQYNKLKLQFFFIFIFFFVHCTSTFSFNSLQDLLSKTFVVFAWCFPQELTLKNAQTYS